MIFDDVIVERPERATINQLLCFVGVRVPPAPETIQLLDVIALTVDLPTHNLVRGQVGTVVELLAPGVYEVEFSDDHGRTYAQLPLRPHQLLVLHYAPQQAA